MSGEATFDNLALATAGAYKLKASCPLVSPVRSRALSSSRLDQPHAFLIEAVIHTQGNGIRWNYIHLRSFAYR